MLSSRNVDDLVTAPKIRCLHFLYLVKAATGIEVLVVCTRRDEEAQNQLFAQGRTRAQLDRAGLGHVEPRPGLIVTNVKGGESFHQYGVAFDCVPLRAGKPVWQSVLPADKALWNVVGGIGEACGLSWSGRWLGKLRELGHFQYTGGLTLAHLRAGQAPAVDTSVALHIVEHLPPELRVRLA